MSKLEQGPWYKQKGLKPVDFHQLFTWRGNICILDEQNKVIRRGKYTELAESWKLAKRRDGEPMDRLGGLWLERITELVNKGQVLLEVVPVEVK